METLTTQNQEGPSAPPNAATGTGNDIGIDTPIIVAEWPKNNREKIRVRLDSYKGNATVCIRVWYDKGDGYLKPSPKGLTVSINHIVALADGLAAALAVAKSRGLVSEGGGA